MIPRNSTPVPNEVFDRYLPLLRPTELTLLLVVIRQTLGWIDPYSRKRKERDWISGSQLRAKTGYSRKSLSTALKTLDRYGLIAAYSAGGELLNTPSKRKGKTRIYYSFTTRHWDAEKIASRTCAKRAHILRTLYAQQKKLLLKKMIVRHLS